MVELYDYLERDHDKSLRIFYFEISAILTEVPLSNKRSTFKFIKKYIII